MTRKDGEWWLDGRPVEAMNAPAARVVAPRAMRGTALADVMTSALTLMCAAASVLAATHHTADVWRPTLVSGGLVAVYAIVGAVGVLRGERLPAAPPELPDGVAPPPAARLRPSRYAAYLALLNAVSGGLALGVCASHVGLESAVIPVFALAFAAEARWLALVWRWERRRGRRLVAGVDRDDPRRVFATVG